jgi:hypothetical protein
VGPDVELPSKQNTEHTWFWELCAQDLSLRVEDIEAGV